MIKKYFFYVNKGLPFGVCFFILFNLFHYLSNRYFENIQWYIIGFVLSVFFASPLYSFIVMRLNKKKDKTL